MPTDFKSDINFNIDETKDDNNENLGGKFVKWTIKSGRIILMIVVVILIVTLVSNLIITEILNKNRNQVDEKIRTLSNYQDTEAEHVRISNQLDDVKLIVDSNIDWRKRFEYLNSFIPQDMTLEAVKFNPDLIELNGSVNSAEGFGLLMSKFLNNDLVTDLIITASSYDKTDKKYTFSLKVGLKVEDLNNE